MKKQMISFTDPQAEFLTAGANRLGISVAELVRRIVDEYREGHERRELRRVRMGVSE